MKVVVALPRPFLVDSSDCVSDDVVSLCLRPTNTFFDCCGLSHLLQYPPSCNSCAKICAENQGVKYFRLRKTLLAWLRHQCRTRLLCPVEVLQSVPSISSRELKNLVPARAEVVKTLAYYYSRERFRSHLGTS